MLRVTSSWTKTQTCVCLFTELVEIQEMRKLRSSNLLMFCVCVCFLCDQSTGHSHCLQSAGGVNHQLPEEKGPVCSLCQFARCKYSHHDQFQVLSLTSSCGKFGKDTRRLHSQIGASSSTSLECRKDGKQRKGFKKKPSYCCWEQKSVLMLDFIILPYHILSVCVM